MEYFKDIILILISGKEVNPNQTNIFEDKFDGNTKQFDEPEIWGTLEKDKRVWKTTMMIEEMWYDIEITIIVWIWERQIK